MIRSVGTILVAVAATGAALAQGVGNADPTAGRQHFEQSCGVCHTKPLITSGRFGPALSKESLGGQSDVMAEVISNGIPQRMPGFKHYLSPVQIGSVIAYIQTLDAPPAEAKPVARTSGERRDDN